MLEIFKFNESLDSYSKFSEGQKGRVSWSKLKKIFFNNNVPLSLENTYNFL